MKFLVYSVKSLTHKKCVQCSCIVQAISQFLLDCAVFSTSYPQVWPVNRVLERWNISKLYLFWNYHGYPILCFTASIELVRVSTVFIFIGRSPVCARNRVPGRPVPVWNVSSWAFSVNLPSDWHFLCFQLIQAPLQLVSPRIYYFVVSAQKWPASAKYRIARCPDQPKPQKLPPVQWKICNKNQALMKSSQA